MGMVDAHIVMNFLGLFAYRAKDAISVAIYESIYTLINFFNVYI